MPPVQPYHYGSHYSNSGTVLHFLVRMPPFTKMFLAYQGESQISWELREKNMFHSSKKSFRKSNYTGSSVTLLSNVFYLKQRCVSKAVFNHID